MNLNDYQIKAISTATYPGQGTFFGLWYAMSGLAGEGCEALEKIKKIFRSHGDNIMGSPYQNCLSVISDEQRREILKETGDVLWYVAAVAYQLGATLEEVAEMNNKKLADRKERNVLHGEGDNR